MAEIISTEDVHLYYGKKEALHGISMNFHENEITALIGLPAAANRRICAASTA